MVGRSGTLKDIRSKIKHENTSLGAGTASSSFSSARHQVPHVGDIFGHHPGSASIGGGLPGLAPSAFPSNPSQQDNSGGSGGPSSFSVGQSAEPPTSDPRLGAHGAGSSANETALQQQQQQQYAGGYGASRTVPKPSAVNTTIDNSQSPSRLGSSSPTPHSPLRPARSVRRPQQAPPIELSSSTGSGHERGKSIGQQRPQLQIPPVSSSRAASDPSSPARSGPGRDLLVSARNQGGHSQQASQSSISAQHLTTPPSDRHNRSAQLMAKVTRSGTPSNQLESDHEEDLYGGISPIDPPAESAHGHPFYSNRAGSSTPNRLSVPGQQKRPERDPRRISGAPLGSLTHDSGPSALPSVLSALTSAGRKKQAARIMRGTTAEEESRRRRTEKKISEASTMRRPLTDYVDKNDSRTFREINAVLRKVKAEWPFVADDDFNSVALALSMLDESSLGSNRNEFESVKAMIETALQGTVNDHYESFATAITLHNSVLQSLTAAQGSVSGARRRLRDSREALGAKRADLVQMWQRQQAVKESLRLLDLVEHLKSVPDRLESLMSEKRFLQAVNLLVRSLKTIEKTEILEVGATNDLRAYLKGQEQAMLEILIEELHNHLYLKSYFCDSRWKSYVAGQEELPVVDFGSDYAADNGSNINLNGNKGSIGQSSSLDKDKTLKLNKYLQSLHTRPTFDPNLASDLPETTLMSTSKSFSALTGELNSLNADSISPSALNGVDSTLSALPGVGGSGLGGDSETNPETDSFVYMEMLLESLSRLGKLGLALDTISQRSAIEVHQLVEATIDEVDARNEPLRRFSIALRPESMLLASSSALARSFSDSLRSSRTSFNTASDRPVSSMLRISAGESSALQRDGETMRDLFWTLFSKLDAVLQGHRVIYEVADMIASRVGFKDDLATKKISGVGSLVEVWKPIQQEVRTLLHDYLMDDEGAASGRNAIISVNDVLRDQRYGRDRSKQLFKLTDPASKRSTNHTVRRREVGPLRRHELAITEALKASVPGLVSSIDSAGATSVNRAGINSINYVSTSAGASVSSGRAEESLMSGMTGAGQHHHRLLVKPDAFNVSVLFQPALSFIKRVEQVMPSEAAGETSNGFSAFLEEFVQEVFLPQLEEKVQHLFVGATSHADSFLEDTKTRRDPPNVMRALNRGDAASGLGPGTLGAGGKPVVKAVTNIIVLIDSLYSMLRTTPFNRESYSRLIITVVIQFYQKCGERFKSLVFSDPDSSSSSSNDHQNSSRGGDGGGGASAFNLSPTDAVAADGYSLSATWAQKPEMYACLLEQLSSYSSVSTTSTASNAISAQKRKQLLGQETKLLLAFANARPQIGVHELTTSRKKLLALGCLQNSLDWFVANLSRLRPISNSETNGDKTPLKQSKRPQARLSIVHSLSTTKSSNNREGASGAGSGEEEEEDLLLPLTPSLLERYKTLTEVFRHLSALVLFTLRMEIRARVIAYLQLSITEVSYLINEAAVEPAPQIVDLNGELANLDDILSDTLSPLNKQFVLSGLPTFIDSVLVKLASKIGTVNRQGVTKMVRNILALQQNLKNILPLHQHQHPGEEAKETSSTNATNAAMLMELDGEVNFDRSKKFYELLYSKSPDELWRNMKLFTFSTSSSGKTGGVGGGSVGFTDLQAILNLALGIPNLNPNPSNANANANVGSTSSVPSTPTTDGSANLMIPNAGTLGLKQVTRQKLNEFLIELHQVAARHVDEDSS